jgi:hypothetical protein
MENPVAKVVANESLEVSAVQDPCGSCSDLASFTGTSNPQKLARTIYQAKMPITQNRRPKKSRINTLVRVGFMHDNTNPAAVMRLKTWGQG